MTELPLTVLYYEDSNVSKAYLEYMFRNGYSPNKIVVLRFLTPKTQKLSKVIGKKFAFSAFATMKKWNQRNALTEEETLLHTELQSHDEYIDFTQKFDLKKYCKNIHYIYLNNFNDANLIKYVENNIDDFFLYTAGGIVPQSFLSIDNLKVLHIHPGVVPSVKGSDGLFWSVLLRGKPGASCFYMNAGIDTGDIIKTQDFDLPKFNLDNVENINAIYNGLLNYYDPHTRAKLLIIVLKNTNALTSIRTEKQQPTDGKTYFAMHPTLLKKTIDKMVC